MKKLPTYEGAFEDGRVNLQPDAENPDRILVNVIVPTREAISVPFVVSPHLTHREKAKDFEKTIIDVA
jgi:hypothetical protein